ncbi:MAG TPA: hypothetical protein VIG08_01560 [Gemmatimonadales bacterium]|jgi:hypothetical protein
MHRVPCLSSLVAIGLTLSALAGAVGAQTGAYPTISERQFTGGSVQLTVTGSAKIDQEIPINTKASFGDGGMTWLQFGNSGSEEPNALVTYGETGEIGITVGKGKFIATGGIIPGERSQCTGDVKVTADLVTGQYACSGITSQDPETGLGKVNITLRFSGQS